MHTISYLESIPLSTIAKYREGHPKDSVPFSGFIRKHPSEKNKLILIQDPLGISPRVMEFKIDDVLHAEDIHSAVTESGEGVPLVKLWIRKGAYGVILEPFEVHEPIRFTSGAKDPPGSFLIE
ncbi:MAG: hypothetical protein LBQ38_08460 [Spirochaetaceae bacterium]|jgi:hypothetical protein|nr:hypothetical protein [Spirochaetaceae bacterium]